jgi:hypothetical protein
MLGSVAIYLVIAVMKVWRQVMEKLRFRQVKAVQIPTFNLITHLNSI